MVISARAGSMGDPLLTKAYDIALLAIIRIEDLHQRLRQLATFFGVLMRYCTTASGYLLASLGQSRKSELNLLLIGRPNT